MLPNLRSLLDHFEQQGWLVRVDKPTGLRFQAAQLIHRYDGKQAVWIENVEGYSIPIVAGIFSRREFIAAALGCEVKNLASHLRQAWQNPIAPEVVGTAPVKELRQYPTDLLHELPIPTHFEKDAGPYITSGVIIAKNPDTGVRNASYARILVRPSNRLVVMINWYRHLYKHLLRAEALGQPLEVAVVIGPPPAVLLEGAMPAGAVPDTVDELAVAGGLIGRPLPIVPCERVNLEVPAESEIVIEGVIPVGVRAEEGPFADYPGVYDAPPRQNPVIEVHCVTRRKDAIYLDILPNSLEHLLVGGVPREADLLARVQSAVPNVTAFYLTEGGICRFHGIVQMAKVHDTDPRHAMLAAFAPTEASRDLKMVIVVDEDVDPLNPRDIEWALATRVQWDRDILLIPGVATALDPSAVVATPPAVRSRGDILTTKIGIDATRPFVDAEYQLLFERAKIPGTP